MKRKFLEFFVPQNESDLDWFDLRNKMVSEQLVARGIQDPRVITAFQKIPRHSFVPAAEWPDAYEDKPIPIGEGQTISQPYIAALMTEAFEVQPGQKILEVGSGSGYQSAILSEMGAEVFSVDINPEISQIAASNLRRAGNKAVRLRTADGFYGWKENSPYDGIIVTCAARKVPQPLVEQLKEGGRMAIPVGEEGRVQELYIMKKINGVMETERTVPVRFVPMRGEGEKPE